MTKKLILTKGYHAMVDADNYEWLSQWKWTAMVTGQNIKRVYAYRREWPSRRVPKRQLAYMTPLHTLNLESSQG